MSKTDSPSKKTSPTSTPAPGKKRPSDVDGSDPAKRIELVTDKVTSLVSYVDLPQQPSKVIPAAMIYFSRRWCEPLQEREKRIV